MGDLPARDLGALELRPHPRGPDPPDLVEAHDAGHAAAADGDGAVGGVEERRWRLRRRRAGSWARSATSAARWSAPCACTFINFFRKPVTVHYPDVKRDYPDRFRGRARPHLRPGDGRGELHRLPALRVHLPAPGHQGGDAQGGEAQLRQDLHPRALRLRVLRALRAGVPDRRHHHDEVVRPGHRGPARAPLRQGPPPRGRAPVRALLGHRQPPARHAVAAQAGQAAEARPGKAAGTAE